MSSPNLKPPKNAEPQPPEFGPGDQVRTPSGAVADVVAIYPSVGEALVQWSSGDRARFLLGVLRKWPEQ